MWLLVEYVLGAEMVLVEMWPDLEENLKRAKDPLLSFQAHGLTVKISKPYFGLYLTSLQKKPASLHTLTDRRESE